MPHTQTKPNPVPVPQTTTAMPWKNSLLTKENPEELQNPVKYFEAFNRDNDTFAVLMEDLQAMRENGELLRYFNHAAKAERELQAFVVVQDMRGVNWICPVWVENDEAHCIITPLDLPPQGNGQAFTWAPGQPQFGIIETSKAEFISACSRGFENASKILLGDEVVRLTPGLRLVACFYIFTREEQK